MWLYNSVLYQIYPIGFCGVSYENDGSTSNNILKINGWAQHFKSLGVGAVLFNPIFEADSHGYDTRDYAKIDARLGTNDDFKSVCTTLKQNGIKIVLDGVFNHVGRGFWAFKDVLEKREASKYVHWFIIDFGGNSNYNDGLYYEGWEGHYELVKLNLKNPEVVDYLLNCVKGWIDEFDIDGLRLDVAYCLEHDFMRNLRTFCTNLKPDFALIGEIIHGDYNLIVKDDMLHSCTNYECYKGLFSSMNDKNLFEISHSLNRQFGSEDWCIYRGKQLMTFVDNHDVSRIYTILNDKNTIDAVYAVLFSMPGVPCIYYGSEWGEPGDKNSGDKSLRPCFDEPKPNELTATIAKMVKARKSSRALCSGSYKNVVINNTHLLFKREHDGETVYVGVNIVADGANINSGELCGDFENILNGENVSLSGSLSLEPYGFVYLRKV